jgi:hypothetical protein
MSSSRERGKNAPPSSEAPEPPRGHAAWKAEKERIAERNEAAYARGRQERMARNAAATQGRRAAERQERANLPSQPQGPA